LRVLVPRFLVHKEEEMYDAFGLFIDLRSVRKVSLRDRHRLVIR